MVVVVFLIFNFQFISFKNKLTMAGNASRSGKWVRLAKFGYTSDFVVISLEERVLLEVVLLVVVSLEAVELLIVLTLRCRTRRHELRAKFLLSVLKITVVEIRSQAKQLIFYYDVVFISFTDEWILSSSFKTTNQADILAEISGPVERLV